MAIGLSYPYETAISHQPIMVGFHLANGLHLYLAVPLQPPTGFADSVLLPSKLAVDVVLTGPIEDFVQSFESFGQKSTLQQSASSRDMSF